MEVKKIKKDIDVNATKEKVWDILLQDNYTRIWYAEFGPGLFVATDWSVDSKAVFSDQTKNGLIGTIRINKPAEMLVIEYQGMLTDGQEDYDSEIATQLKGGKEIYLLTERNNQVHLSIESDMGEEHFEFMSAAWERALQEIKRLAESN